MSVYTMLICRVWSDHRPSGQARSAGFLRRPGAQAHLAKARKLVGAPGEDRRGAGEPDWILHLVSKFF